MHLHELQRTYDAPPNVRLTGRAIVHMSSRHGVVDRCARAVAKRFVSPDHHTVPLTQPEYWSNIVCSALSAAGVYMFIEEVTPEQNWLTIINTDALSLEVVLCRSPKALSAYEIRTYFQMRSALRPATFKTNVKKHNKLYPDMPSYMLTSVGALAGDAPIYSHRLSILSRHTSIIQPGGM